MRLADNESVKKMYDLWCEMEQQKHDVYSSARVQFSNLVDNKEFRSVKNMIVKTVMKMDFPMIEMEVELPESTEIDFDIPLQIDKEIINEIFSLLFCDHQASIHYSKSTCEPLYKKELLHLMYNLF